MLLGELLVQKGILNSRQLTEALLEQKRTNEFLGAILIKRKYVTEEQLIQVLSEQFNIPFLDLKSQYIDWEAALRFPSSLVVDHEFLPIRWDAKGVTVVVTNPLDAYATSEAERIASFEKVNFALVTSEAMKEALKTYKQKVADKIKGLFDKP